MKKVIVLAGLLGSLVLLAFSVRRKDQFPIPGGWPKPYYNFRKHPLSKEKVALGRLLFYDPILSADNTISCASCHAQSSSFTHADHNLSHGIGGKIGTRNSPVLINMAWSRSFMWDGAVDNLDEQAAKPITNPLEMGETIAHVTAKLKASARYPALFYHAYGDSAITGEMVTGALTQFVLTMVSANAKYDKVMRGEDKFSEHEAKGYALFQQHCSTCHTEPLFTNSAFENNGLEPDTALADLGLMKITGKAADSLKFKVPTLRNIEYSAPYMHDGRFKTLNTVLNNYIRGLQHGPTLSPKLQKGIYFTTDEKSDVLAFLLTLSDKQFLKDPQFSYPAK